MPWLRDSHGHYSIREGEGKKTKESKMLKSCSMLHQPERVHRRAVRAEVQKKMVLGCRQWTRVGRILKECLVHRDHGEKH